MFRYKKNFFFALSILIGTIVGAGIFGIPYVIAKSGIIPGFFYFFVLGSAVLLVHLFLAEIVLRTQGKHRIIGYAQKYLGNWGKLLIAISVVVGLSGALLAYTILGGNFLAIIFSPWIQASNFHLSLFFLFFLSYFIFRGIKVIAPAEILTNLIFAFILILVFWFGLPKVNLQNFVLLRSGNLFLPYGVILFSLLGWTAIPEVADILKSSEERRGFKKIIILATTVIFFFYWLFIFTVLGVSGKETSPEALTGLVPFLGGKIVFFGALAAVITLADSFLAIGLSLKNTLIYDLKFPKIAAFIFTCGLPLILFLIGFRSFIETIGFIGTIIGAIEGVVIILIFQRVKNLGDREPEYSLKIPAFFLYLLVAMFIFGAISQFFNF